MTNLFESEFGGAAGISDATGTTSRGFTAGITNTSAPPMASAAPTAAKENIFTGLCEALNTYQQGLIKAKKREVADQYVIEFAPPEIGASTVQRPGPQDSTTAPMQTQDSAGKLNPAENKINRSGRTWPIEAGTQIIKVIDDVMRNSSYITSQQNVEVSTATDPVTGIQQQKRNVKPGSGDMRWYKISLALEWLAYDNRIRDHAFKMTFLITPYPVGQMTSIYFPDSRYRGVHKAYNHWFTGENTQILQYEQQYNNTFRIVMNGTGPNPQPPSRIDFRDQNRYIYMATSSDQATGAKNYANAPGDSAASFFYDPKSLSQVKMRIVGDPAWMQQGEVATGVSARTFDFNPFNADGTINYDSQAVMFSVAFNTPDDYNLATGLVEVNKQRRGGQPQEYYTFQATKCKNIFSKGKFEQELEGKLVTEKNTQSNRTAATTTSGRATVPGAGTVTPGIRTTDVPTSLPYDGSLGYAIQDETGQVSDLRRNEYGDLYEPTAQNNDTAGIPTPRPAAAPRPATSSGDIVSDTGPSVNPEFGGFAQAFEVIAPPSNASAIDNSVNISNSTLIQQTQSAIARNRELIAAAAPGSPVSNRLQSDNRSLESALVNLRSKESAARGGSTSQGPQIIAKDD